MERLIELFRRKIAVTLLDFVRSMEQVIPWDARLVGLRGARGIGKTTLFLQHIKKHFEHDLSKVLYVSLDNLWFTEHSLLELADTFYKQGGTHLFLDEVHKYPQWSVAVKNLYDDYPELHIAFTGSSLLEILDARADLSRRAVVFNMQGLSFREFLMLRTGKSFPVYKLQDILENHERIAGEIVSQVHPYQYFSEYLRLGYYPYFLESIDTYFIRLEETINMILEIELPQLRHIEVASIPKIKRLLGVIAESAPFIPNISRLSEHVGIHRHTVLAYLQALHEAKLIYALYRNAHGISALQKPEKIYLENTNLMYLLKGDSVEIGTIRETFFANQVSQNHTIEYTESGDFRIDGHVTVEVGGKHKTRKQIQHLQDAYIASDNLEYGYDKKIPLWLFGFLY
jgi:hypothetical protein